jgi:cell filamentation protein
MTEDPYLYPGTAVVWNRLGTTSAGELDAQERRFVVARSTQGVPKGNFDLDHLKAIHKGLSSQDFAYAVGNIVGDVNYVHPFREGNGRTQLQYLKQLAQQAAYSLDLTKLDRIAWLQASRAAHQARFDCMARCIEGALCRTGANGDRKKA